MVKRIEALGRGLAVLERLEAAGPVGLSELARQCALSKATLLRILLTLEAAGFARRRLADRLWDATARRPPMAANPHSRLAEIAGPVLDALCQKVLWPSDVGVYDDGAIRVLETSRRLSPFLVNRDVVASRIHVIPSAMGRAIIAWSRRGVRAGIVADLAVQDEPHDRLIHDAPGLARLIGETRERGYAVRHPGYFISVPREARVTAVAVPVIRAGKAIAAINLSWVESAMTEAEFASRHLGDLTRAAAEIAARLGRASRG